MGRIPSTHETILLCLFLLYLIQHCNFSAKLWLPKLFGYAYLNILRISCIWAILSLDPWLFSREGDFPKQVWTWCALNGWVEMAIIFHWDRSFDLFLSCHSFCTSSYRIALMFLIIWVVWFWTHVLGLDEEPLGSGLASVEQNATSHLRGACRSAFALPIPHHTKRAAAPSDWARSLSAKATK